MAQESIGKRFEGYQVYDRHYEKVGKVDDLFVDENDQPEYIGVKTGFLGGRSTLIPMDIVRVNDVRQLVEVASEKDTIKDAPSFGDDSEITAEFEDRVYAHFGTTREAPQADRGGYSAYNGGDPDVDLAYGERASASEPGGAPAPVEYEYPTGYREAGDSRAHDAEYPSDSTNEEHGYADAEPREVETGRVYEWDIGTERRRETSAGEERPDREREEAGEVGPGMSMGDAESGEFRGHASDNEGIGQRQSSDLEDGDELRVQRSEEELRAGTREREAGSVNVRKRVRIDRERLSVPTRREEVSVERMPVSGEATEAQIGEDEVSVPVVEDEVVVQKKPVAKEEIRVRKDVVEDTEIIEEDVRREEIDIEDNTSGRRGT